MLADLCDAASGLSRLIKNASNARPIYFHPYILVVVSTSLSCPRSRLALLHCKPEYDLNSTKWKRLWKSSPSDPISVLQKEALLRVSCSPAAAVWPSRTGSNPDTLNAQRRSMLQTLRSTDWHAWYGCTSFLSLLGLSLFHSFVPEPSARPNDSIYGE